MTHDSLSIANTVASLPRVAAASSSVEQSGDSAQASAVATAPSAQRQADAVQGERLPPAAAQSRQRLDGAVQNLKSFVQNIQRELNFSIDEGSGLTVVKIIDSRTDEVIRQIPAEEVLAIAEQIRAAQEARQEPPQGLLFKEKA